MSDQDTNESRQGIDTDITEAVFAKVGDYLKAGDHRFPMHELGSYSVQKNPRKTDKWHVQLTYSAFGAIRTIEVPFDSDTEAYEAVGQLDQLVKANSGKRF